MHGTPTALAAALRAAGVEVVHASFFDTVLARVPGRAADVVDAARADGINLRQVDADHVGISLRRDDRRRHLGRVCRAFGVRYDASLERSRCRRSCAADDATT